MNPSVQMASPSASSCNCTWNTRNMQHVCNPQCLLKCASRAHQTMDFSSKQARSTLSWSRAAWSIYNRWQTLHSGIDYIDYDDADDAGLAAMVPVLSILPSMFSPAVTCAADRPITASADRLANQSARTQFAFVRRVWDDAIEAPMPRFLMNRCVYSFTDYYGLKKMVLK